MKNKYTVDYIRKNNLILFEAISGSVAFNLNDENSDVDIRGVFIMEENDIYGSEYIEQINENNNDITFYEIRKFIELLSKNNPNALELLNMPEHCIIFKHELFDLLQPSIFLAKTCYDTYLNYAKGQIEQARGLNKKIVNPVDKIKKSPLDFCYILIDGKTIDLIKYLNDNNINQKFCGLTKADKTTNVYFLYHDVNCQNIFSKEIIEKDLKSYGLGYKGIVKEDLNGEFTSNQLRLSSIPKGEKSIGIISYNQNGYETYCKRYKEYWQWIIDRNEKRYLRDEETGYNCKNVSHCLRLLAVCRDIFLLNEIINYKTGDERDFLYDVKKGVYSYEEALLFKDKYVEEVNNAFENSYLKNVEVDMNLTNKLLISIRKKFYIK